MDILNKTDSIVNRVKQKIFNIINVMGNMGPETFVFTRFDNIVFKLYNVVDKGGIVMDLKDILIKYREDNKISQRELARRSGLSNAQISILEYGINKQTGRKPTPDIITMKKLADGMGMSLQSLFDMIGNSEFVSLNTRKDNYPIVIPNTDRFLRIMASMEPQDYETIMRIYTKTYKRMKEAGEIDI